MHDRDKETEQLNNDELAECKSLSRDAETGSFTLEDILAEYGTRRSTQRSAVPVSAPAARAAADTGKVVAFPGRPVPPPAEEPEAAPFEADGPVEEDAGTPEDGEDGGETGRVVDFPEEESVLSAFLKDITRKADRYADQMFQESERMDPEEVRRLEELIPGTDQETPPEPPGRIRRPRKPEPPPPDLPPQELARTYGKGLKGMRLRTVLVFLLAAAALFQLAVPAAGFYWLPPLDGYQIQVWISAGLLGLGTLLSLDVLWAGLRRALRGRVEMDTLAALSVLFTLADALTLSLSQDREGQLPYAAAALAGLFFLLHGSYHKRCGLRLSCRTAASAAEPYILTLDEGKWNGRDTYCKWSGVPNGFGSQVQMDDGAQRIYRVVADHLVGFLLRCGFEAHLPGGLSSAAAGLPAVLSAGLLWTRQAPASVVVPLRHLHRLRRLWRGPGVWPPLPQAGPAAGLQRRGPGRMAGHGPVRKGGPHPPHRRRPVPSRLCGAQRHQGIRRLVH